MCRIFTLNLLCNHCVKSVCIWSFLVGFLPDSDWIWRDTRISGGLSLLIMLMFEFIDTYLMKDESKNTKTALIVNIGNTNTFFFLVWAHRPPQRRKWHGDHQYIKWNFSIVELFPLFTMSGQFKASIYLWEQIPGGDFQNKFWTASVLN